VDKNTFIFFAIWIIVLVYAIGKSRTGLGRYFFPQRQSKFHHSTLVSVLLHLPDAAVDELLDLYKTEFGTGPRDTRDRL
jgi:hypothetical protein